ncbi:Na+/H+ antiporter NhaC family protein [Clostridium botulinum]|uniref:Na+/H+ antiporter NhaC family protein n=1 Tax=Clostridium botulinum TaxID=1491 RepID=UPI00016B9C68|nr:Na+/H+ antiporter NhaC family protein [Clostridium botulinum]EDT86281.1 Na+/H+ antiporter family protein [Clostridium botulinum Bf]MBY6881547.1 Na+/H+ antiporter NhaC family protein [Clostridium botulinum]NEZ87184.1 Na+/H+ antiporter NhaC family protein [Clostridium botulinum]NFB01492.1 Na+/H+ antiporter NhaC family protein [Clostridium botulinum]NFE30908.1 Na+/H+ antiporter NhaC family protein [Clostridium botulinum]
MGNTNENKGNGKALIPFAIFVLVYLCSGIILSIMGVEMAFYQFPAPIAVVIGIIFAFILIQGTLDEKMDSFVKGCGDENIIIMCIIYLLAGGFSAVSKAMGGADATVNLGLTLIPPQFIVVGIFLISAFISIATGTSVGTVVAVGPIAVQLVAKAGLNMPLALGALVGGALYGDNLSIISDTTIAATRTQGVDMKDKFRVNFGFATVAALVTIAFLFIFGKPVTTPKMASHSFNLIKIIPYMFVLIAALAGKNVFAVLMGGIILSGAIGIGYGDFTILGFAKEVYGGFTGMFDIFSLSLLTGGLANMVSKGGGLDWLLYKINKMIKGKKSAELGISSLVALTDAATANNTVSIIVCGELSKEISKEYKIDPRKTASLLSTFSMAMQGIIPYGAQLLIAGSFTKGSVSPVQIVPYMWYPFILTIFGIIFILTPFGNGYLKKHPWNFENSRPAVNGSFENSKPVEKA